jgi:protein-S-isoprenylcysteine O-methyltransferase Ste14
VNDSPQPPAARHPLITLTMALAVTALDAVLLALALGGIAPLRAHPRALALLAIWGAGATLLGFLRPVRALDTAREDRDPALLLIALFAIPMLTPPLAAWGERFALWPLPGGDALRWGGVALAACGLALRTAAMVRLGRRFAPFPAIQRDHALETRGVYGVVRHPGYAGAWLANLGAALAFGSAVGLAGVALMTIALELRARREEALLEAHFGEAYLRYRARTGRVIPRIGPARDA